MLQLCSQHTTVRNVRCKVTAKIIKIFLLKKLARCESARTRMNIGWNCQKLKLSERDSGKRNFSPKIT